jgi:ABC-2 type transport system permease protein
MNGAIDVRRRLAAIRWLLIKDLQILRRSPLLVALLALYPVAIALLIGFALSSPPGKPKVAFLSEVPPGKGTIALGGQRINIAGYARNLFQSIDPVKVETRAEAIAKVRDGQALAALIVPADIATQIESLVTTGVGSPSVELILNTKDPLERQYVDQAIDSRIREVEQAVSAQVLQVAIADLQQVLNGGQIQFLGQSFPLLGLRDSNSILRSAIAALPRSSPLRGALGEVASFAQLAITGLGFAKPVLGSIGTPLTVQRSELSGKTTPSDAYAVAIAVVVSLMFLALLLAAGMLAIEREEHAWTRLVRGLVSPGALLAEKVLLSAGAAAAVTLVMAAGVSLFVHLQWARLELWVLAVGFGGLAFGALGVALGALAREVRTASLLSLLVALPVAFAALVPGDAVSGGLKAALDVVGFVFPFKAGLEAVANAFSATSPAIGLPLLHLAALTVAFWALARLAVRRFA